MAADDDQVAAIFGRHTMDFLAGMTEGYLQLLGGQAEVAGEQLHAFAGLFELLLLQHGQIHGNVAAIGHGQGFNDMNNGQLGIQCLGQLSSVICHGATFVDQVDRDQHM